jgi:glycosyltransferase involved in cell wall biosynthesis
MTRVLMCGPLADNGGVAIHTKYLIKELSQKNVEVLTFNFNKKYIFGSSISKTYQRTIGMFFSAIKNRNKYEIIHTQTSGGIFSFISAVTGSIVAQLLDKKIIVTFHNSAQIGTLASKYKFLFSFVFKNVDKMILVSNNQKEMLSTYFPIYSPRMVVIPNGYDSSLFFAQDVGICRNELGLSMKKKIILSVGNLLEVKGHKHLIKAIESVIKHRKDVQCYIVGSGILERKLKEQVISAELQDYIIFVGGKSHDEIPLWINACDMFVLPSINEGNPTVMFECLGCGKPFVGTKVGGVPEIISSEDYGLLVDSKDSKDLAEKIIFALDKEWNSTEILVYANQYQWENIAEQVQQIYAL